MGEPERYRLVVVAPVYEDAESAALLLGNLGRTFAGLDVTLRVLLVDDGSPVPLIQQLKLPADIPLPHVAVLRLRRNVGHQRAIALGAAFVHEKIPCDAMLVMDADGEDRPEDATRLLARCRELAGERVVFAERTRRSESPLFLGLYQLYRLLHWVLTGISVRVGNFSIVPASRLPALVTLPALWNHYAAAIFQARLPRELLPTARGTRYRGASKMNFVGLVMHGLQAISVFSDVVAVRLLLAVCLLAGGCGALAAGSVATLLYGGPALPPWAPYAIGGLLIAALTLVLGCFSLALTLLTQRNSLDFIPIRDYHYFIESSVTVHE
ncbi:MAG: glycosyltransferase [Verrucomicrobiota bacterium]